MKLIRKGITLVELSVVVAILAILLGLVLVGVQTARESARRIACQNNLHQIGIAVTNFSQSTRSFPSLFANRGSKGDAAFDQSVLVAILPELEVVFKKYDPLLLNDDPSNLPPTFFRCPSGNKFLGYRFNYGSGVRTLDKLDGIIRLYKGLRPDEVTDGLSNTSLASERMSGDEHRKPIGVASLPVYLTDEGFASDCIKLKNPTAFKFDTGIKWQGYQPLDLVYGHFSTPNNSHWDCQGSLRHLLSARSYHSRSVLVLLADGHVAWYSSAVEPMTWVALGTVAGNESSSSP
jgi:prepilin-type N-terminal cleavage/methylation domain-containing protein